MPLRLTVNDAPLELQVPPQELLLDTLRERLGLTGAKRACDLQVCGACTVLVDEQPVSACTYLSVDADGCRVETIEGLAAEGRLHPLQRAFVEHGAVQCGYCTPGMIMMAKSLLAALPSDADDEQIRLYLLGNLCRCTGYAKILDAVRAVLRQGQTGSAA
ncbi:MAG: (2Fe-2S)-binding protein [Candidatus Tectomicrobia bacterium]|nr:(2Fe-2S)-binding protein [Candidatus Tectomicrobia bacterium]